MIKMHSPASNSSLLFWHPVTFSGHILFLLEKGTKEPPLHAHGGFALFKEGSFQLNNEVVKGALRVAVLG